MPTRHGAHLPETKHVGKLVAGAPSRVASMLTCPTEAGAPVPPPAVLGRARHKLTVLRDAAATCRACDIGCHATQVVFGEGPENARIVLVGEQPGDMEDRKGQPFVGPAGRLLDGILKDAGIDRSGVYVTNAVKHFKYITPPRGKRRIHQKPTYHEVTACKPWLEAEISVLRPAAIVCLGATAGQAFLGTKFRLQRVRGRIDASPWAPLFMATWHPSALLRAGHADATQAMRAEMTADLLALSERLKQLAA